MEEITQRVTLLLPVKNGMPYLSETLASIEAQTYCNWQILAWDNGSTDGTLEELHRWIPSRLPGEIVSNQPMILGACRAELVKQSSTELCACIDADDINLPERLEKQINFLLLHPNIAIVGTQIHFINENEEPIGGGFHMPHSHADIVYFLLAGWGFNQPSVMFRRSAVLDVGNYRDVGHVNVEDVDLWLRLLTRHSGANLDEPLVKYRIHAQSGSVKDGKRVVDEATLVRFCEHAPDLFGITPRQALLFRGQRYPFAVPLILRIAKHLQKTQGGHWRRHLSSGWFLDSARHNLWPQDVLTRLWLAGIDPRENAFKQEISALFRALQRRLASKKAPGTSL